jgi:MFS family permease
MLDLLRHERRARIYLLAHLQSAFGTGAAYVALLVVAWERWSSPWAITAVLLAGLLPAMLLGPLVGAAADRWSRRGCLVAADVVRALAFAGLAVAGSFELTFALALVAGVGTALFNPTIMAALPGMVARERVPAATSLFGAITQLGATAGPGVAAAALLVAGPEPLLAANAVSFAVSAVALLAVPVRRPAPVDALTRRSLVRDARDAVRATAADAGLRTLLLSSSAFVLFLGMVDVGELVLAREALGASDAQFAVLVAVMGVGIAAGSAAGKGGGGPHVLKRRYLGGLFLTGAGLVLAASAPGFAVAVVAFALAGAGNGLGLVHERLLLQTTVPDERLGRVFGVKSALVSWTFAGSFLSGGAVLALLGPRVLFLVAGCGAAAAAALAAHALRDRWTAPVPAAEPSPAAG